MLIRKDDFGHGMQLACEWLVMTFAAVAFQLRVKTMAPSPFYTRNFGQTGRWR
jgi:hypothetical protein